MALFAGQRNRRSNFRAGISEGTFEFPAPYFWAADSLWWNPGGAGAMMWFFSVLAGLLTGILSGFGIGGGTLLIL